jgi:hypothetical protein
MRSLETHLIGNLPKGSPLGAEMAHQISRTHPKPSGDIFLQTTLPEFLLKDCTHTLHELGGLDGPCEADVGCTLMHRALSSAHTNDKEE